MKPVEFPEQTTVFAKNQRSHRPGDRPYLPLPAWVQPVGAAYRITSKWALSWRERWAILFRGHLFISMLTDGNPQPVRPWIFK